MKKVMYFVFFVLMIVVISKPRYDLSGDMIRFRVIPNSNSFEDINMKEKVVSELSSILFKGSDDINVMRSDIVSNLDTVKSRIDKLFQENDYKLKYKVKYGMNYFPRKEYKDIEFDEGEYESLVVEIGEAKGNNYWCILYPPLCMVDYENSDDVKYKSKIYELFSKIF